VSSFYCDFLGYDIHTGLDLPEESRVGTLRALPPIALPPLPFDYTALSRQAIAQSYLEGHYPICVTAAIARGVGLLTGLNKSGQLIWTDKQIIDFQTAVTGRPPNGTILNDKASISMALAVWMNYGAPLGSNHKLLGFCVLDGKNTRDCQMGFWLTGIELLGFDFPTAWVRSLRPGFTWDADNGPLEGTRDCVLVVGVAPNGLMVCSHGMLGTLTYSALATNVSRERGGEVYCGLSADIIDTVAGKCPANLTLAELVSLYNQIDGHQPVPAPGPPVPPVPPPVSDVAITIGGVVQPGTYKLVRA